MSPSNSNIASSIFVVFGFLFLLLLPFDKILIPFGLDDFKEQYLGDAVKNLVIIIFGYMLIKRFGYTRVSGITNFFPKHSILLLVPLYFILLGPLQYIFEGYQFQNVQILNVFILFGSMITVGLSEEIIFRGFILPHLIEGTPSDQSLLFPIFFASLLFGMLHLLNLLQPDTHLFLIFSQVGYATMFGVAFGILLLRTGSIFPLGFLHGIINFSSNWDDLPGTIGPADPELYLTEEAIFSVIIVLPFLFFALWQVAKIDRTTLMSMYQSNH